MNDWHSQDGRAGDDTSCYLQGRVTSCKYLQIKPPWQGLLADLLA
jgi:hypothetical protein